MCELRLSYQNVPSFHSFSRIIGQKTAERKAGNEEEGKKERANEKYRSFFLFATLHVYLEGENPLQKSKHFQQKQ